MNPIDMYKENLIFHYNNPTNKYEMEKFTFSCDATNASCGDKIKIFLKTDKNNNILKASFVGEGCVISLATASILLELCENKKLEDVKKITKKELLELVKVPISKSREKCFLLALSCLRGIKTN